MPLVHIGAALHNAVRHVDQSESERGSSKKETKKERRKRENE
jgi:hypothetical protein